MKRLQVTPLLLLALAASAQDRRVAPITVQRKQALIIGNAAYARAPLKNPANDAVAMDAALRKLGFEVRTLQNLDLSHFEAAIDDFTAGLSAGSLAVFYFSGHGIQVNETNYLLPVDFAASSEVDVKYKAYPASQVQEKMEASGARLRVLVLDACRNNPFRFTRDASGGLASMQVNAVGTLIGFATGDNNTADDNAADANGLYTKYLIPALQAPGLQLREAFQKAKEDVYAASKGRQNPSIYENIVGRYYLVSPPSTGGTGAPLDAAAEAWALIKDSQRPDDFDDFVAAFPSSSLSAAAKLRSSQLRRNTDTVASLHGDNPPIQPSEPLAVKIKRNPKDRLNYAWIPAGTFMLGCSPRDNDCQGIEKPSRQVTITKGFWLGQTEVTQAAYERVAVNRNPSYWKNDNFPVEQVTWNEADAYCRAVGGRLPTEAEWEYAARARVDGARYGDIERVAWYNGNAESKTHLVAKKDGNGWGLYDMLGNVWEWTADWYSEDLPAGAADPHGPASGRYRVLRGGSWENDPPKTRVSARSGTDPGSQLNYIGFRCLDDRP